MKTLPKIRYAPPHSSRLGDDLRQAARDYLQAHGDHRYSDGGMIAKTLFLMGCTAGLYALMTTTAQAWVFVLAYIAFPFVAMILAMNVLHDGAHQALSPWPWLDRLLARLTAMPLGVEPAYWATRHVHYHHAYANVEHYDLDTTANRFLRQTPFQPWYPHFRHQHRYWPVIAALSLPYINWIYDWSDRLGLTPLKSDRVLSGLGGWGIFLFTKIVHLVIAVAIPIGLAHQLGISWGWVLLCYFAGQMLASCVLVGLILGTHWSDVTFYLPPESGQMPHTWHEHAFHTACDWQPKPAWIGYWLGGLNLHLTHHLFPTYHHRHYPALAALVAQAAAQHGVAYRTLSYTELIAKQQLFLRTMGTKPE